MHAIYFDRIKKPCLLTVRRALKESMALANDRTAFVFLLPALQLTHERRRFDLHLKLTSLIRTVLIPTWLEAKAPASLYQGNTFW